MKIGFAGIGRMGEPMTLRLLGAGFSVMVWNRTRERLPRVIAAGAIAAESLSALAEQSDAVLTMVTDDAAVEQVYIGPGGLFATDVSGKIFCDLSTVLPETIRGIAREAQQQRASFVDAPVAGTVQPARDGRLLIFAGGEASDVERLMPVFNALARRIDHIGPVGSGAAMKLVHNALLTACWAALGDAMELGSRFGLDFKRMLDVIQESPAAFAALPVKRPILLGGPSEIGFTIASVQKDLRTILSFAETLDLHPQVVRAVQTSFEKAAAKGLADQDVATIARPAMQSM
jgi:3-hydroxyisobutyrate dehydrogenase